MSAVTLSGTYTESSYMNGQIYGANVSRDFFKNKLQTSIGYHYVDYTMPENDLKEIQHIGEINLYWMLPAKMAFGINYEEHLNSSTNITGFIFSSGKDSDLTYQISG